MPFQIEVVRVKVDSQGKFRVAVVDHKVAGKVDSKKLVSFGPGAAAFNVLSQAQQGDVFDITSEKIKNPKDGKEYWTWVAATSVGKADGTTSTKEAPRAGRSSFETPDERAARQVYIVRQSSIANAVELAKVNGDEQPFTPADIMDVARQFEAYVFGNDAVVIKDAEVS